MKSCDVVIVGAGPAGLSFARALAGSGLRLHIVDNHSPEELAAPPFDGREIALTHPSKNLLRSLGIWAGIPEAEIHLLKEAKVVNGNSPYLLHFPLPSCNSSGEAIEALGYLVSNHLIRRAAYEATRDQADLHWHLGRKVCAAESDDAQGRVKLDNGEVLEAPLIVAADSRFSFVRRAMGIATDSHDFGRTVMVFRLQHQYSNEHSAFECFFYGETLALLPLTEKLTNCVITLDSRRLSYMKSLSPEALAAHVTRELDGRLGAMSLASTIHDYPLVGVHARRFYAPRCALIGDAACGMHPVTAHGFNLGLQSQAILSRLILRQAGMGADLGARAMLARYNAEHMKNTRPLYHGTNAIVKLFTRETPTARALRAGVLRLSNALPPLKTLITRQLTG